ncbi:hypothetical protein QP097_09560 [Oligella urethralis]|uniref:hypothetical protein n=1 Tax=Oligella urethralis TaxID=90245 RepID=UPI00254A26BE|nr:hypothetical protein [Oligella urethralis]MDK6203705.1 hypothetical protein [Oligella urethralis]
MKIKYTNRYRTVILDVFGIYWGMRNEGTKEEEVFTYFYAIYGPQDAALGVYDSKEVEVVDPRLEGEWVYTGNMRFNGVCYAPLAKERLLDDVIDRDPEAIKRFLQFAIQDGLLDAELYKDAL